MKTKHSLHRGGFTLDTSSVYGRRFNKALQSPWCSAGGSAGRRSHRLTLHSQTKRKSLQSHTGQQKACGETNQLPECLISSHHIKHEVQPWTKFSMFIFLQLIWAGVENHHKYKSVFRFNMETLCVCVWLLSFLLSKRNISTLWEMCWVTFLQRIRWEV